LVNIRKTILTIFFGILVALSAAADEEPKRGGTLTYLIAADAPPSFDAHREGTFATVYSAAPFYSVLIRVNPDNPGSPADFVCDLCTEMPRPTEDGKTYTFKIRDGVKWHDGSPLTAADVAASWEHIVHPPEGILSPRESHYMMVDKIEAPNSMTVVFHLKFATSAFLPALADPYSWIYKKEILDKDPRWYEKNILGSGPFKFVSYEVGSTIKGERNPEYYHQGLPYLDGFTGLYAPKQAVRVDAIRSDRAAIDFRNLPPAARDDRRQAFFRRRARYRISADGAPRRRRLSPSPEPLPTKTCSGLIPRWSASTSSSSSASERGPWRP
jgi:peptide/nickel transport system substrate-binding protein